MTYPNMTLPGLPDVIDLRIGTDQAERALQLSYWQVFAGMQALQSIKEDGLYPETVVNAGEEAAFDTALAALIAALSAADAQYKAIWAMVP